MAGERIEVQEFIDFANAIVPDSTEAISDLKSGEVWLELLNVMKEDTVKADKINKGKDLSEKECKKNYKALKKTLSKMEVEYLPALDNNIDAILDGDEQANYEVAVWFKQYFEENAEVNVLEKIKNDIEVMQNREPDFQPAEITLPDDVEVGDEAVEKPSQEDEEMATFEEPEDAELSAPPEEAEADDAAPSGEEEGAAEAGIEEKLAEEEIEYPNEVADEAADEVPEAVEEAAPEASDEAATILNEEFQQPEEEPMDYGAPEEETDVPDVTPVEEDMEADDAPDDAPEEVTVGAENEPEDMKEASVEETFTEEGLVEEADSFKVDDDALKTIKKIALLAACGALLVCAIGCGCYYRKRCGSSAEASKSGGLFARLKSAFTKTPSAKISTDLKTDGASGKVGASAKVTGDLKTAGGSGKIDADSSSGASDKGSGELEIPDKIIEKLWDWFQKDPAKKAYIYLEKKE